VLQITGSSVDLGFAVALQYVPILLLGSYGAWSPTGTRSAGSCTSPRARPESWRSCWRHGHDAPRHGGLVYGLAFLLAW